MQKENNVVISSPFAGKAVVGQAPGVRVDNVRATRLKTCNPLAPARGRFVVVGQALPDNAPAKGHLDVVKQGFTQLCPLSLRERMGVAQVRGKVNKANLICTPSSALRASSPSRGKRTSAFTLIELLVVVLIIGILAAVAVPQYQKAVAKARLATMFSLVKNITYALEIYYLTNDTYPVSLEDIDITFPSDCSIKYSWIQCDSNYTFLHYLRDMGTIDINYCPQQTSSDLCVLNRDLLVSFRLQHSVNAQQPIVCIPVTSLGNSICKNLIKG